MRVTPGRVVWASLTLWLTWLVWQNGSPFGW
jgi:hypothetical protein